MSGVSRRAGENVLLLSSEEKITAIQHKRCGWCRSTNPVELYKLKLENIVPIAHDGKPTHPWEFKMLRDGIDPRPVQTKLAVSETADKEVVAKERESKLRSSSSS